MFSSLHQSPPLGETGIPALISWKRYKASVFANRKKNPRDFSWAFFLSQPRFGNTGHWFHALLSPDHFDFGIQGSPDTSALCHSRAPMTKTSSAAATRRSTDFRRFEGETYRFIQFFMRIAHELICLFSKYTHTPFKTPSLLSLQRNGAKKMHEDK